MRDIKLAQKCNKLLESIQPNNVLTDQSDSVIYVIKNSHKQSSKSTKQVMEVNDMKTLVSLCSQVRLVNLCKCACCDLGCVQPRKYGAKRLLKRWCVEHCSDATTAGEKDILCVFLKNFQSRMKSV